MNTNWKEITEQTVSSFQEEDKRKRQKAEATRAELENRAARDEEILRRSHEQTIEMFRQ